MNIMVRNLSELVTEEKLIAQFRPYGTVSAASIVTDKTSGQSRGFGFVDMPAEAEARAAIKALHHTKFFKEKIRVKEANPKFGPSYFSEHEQLQTATPQAMPLRLERTSGEPVVKPFVKGAFGKGRGGSLKKIYKPEFSKREAPGHSYSDRKPEYRARNERPFARPFSSDGMHRSSGRSVRPESNFGDRSNSSPATAGRREYQPRGERPFSRPGYKPAGERNYNQHNSNERKEYAYPRFPKRDYAKSASALKAESRYGYRSSGERYIKSQSGFPSKEGRSFSSSARKEYRPGSEQPFDRHSANVRRNKPYSRFTKQSGRKSG